ncbi:MAG: hypothetical protein ACI9JN_000441 [Bacteroidia bacterium]|jgi:hypothetical protein
MVRNCTLFISLLLISTVSLTQTTDLIVANDSLVLKWGDSIKYNANPTNRKIKTLFYQSTPCLGTCPIFDLIIDSLGNILFDAKGYNKSVCEGTYKRKLLIETFTEINDIINYIDFENLKDRYSMGMTDLPKGVVDVTFYNGDVKKISDSGKNGTKSLRLLHNYLLNLCYTGNWENVQNCQLPCDSIISRKELLEITQICPNGCTIPYSVDSILSYSLIIHRGEEMTWYMPKLYKTPCISWRVKNRLDFRRIDKITIDNLTVRSNGVTVVIDAFTYKIE